MNAFKVGMRVLNKGTKAINKSLKENARIQKGIMQFQESLELAQTSPNPDTRVSRMRVATQKLAHMIQEFPFATQRKEWEKTYKELVAAYPSFFVANIAKIILTDVPKIEALESQASKAGRAAKLAAKVQSYIGQCPEADGWIAEQVQLIKRAFPAKGEAESGLTIPSEWHSTRFSGIEDIPAESNSAPQPAGKPYKTVGWFAKILIFIGWGAVYTAIFDNPENQALAIAALVLAIICTYCTVKLINNYRADKAKKS